MERTAMGCELSMRNRVGKQCVPGPSTASQKKTSTRRV